jgi:hypothetical protein
MRKRLSRPPGIGNIGHASFFRQRTAIEPFQQLPPECAHNADLRKVNVRIDEAGKQKAAAQIGHRRRGMGGGYGKVLSASSDASILDQQTAVFVKT